MGIDFPKLQPLLPLLLFPFFELPLPFAEDARCCPAAAVEGCAAGLAEGHQAVLQASLVPYCEPYMAHSAAHANSKNGSTHDTAHHTYTAQTAAHAHSTTGTSTPYHATHIYELSTGRWLLSTCGNTQPIHNTPRAVHSTWNTAYGSVGCTVGTVQFIITGKWLCLPRHAAPSPPAQGTSQGSSWKWSYQTGYSQPPAQPW